MNIFVAAVVFTLTWTPTDSVVTRNEFRSRDSDAASWVARGHTMTGGGSANVMQTERAVSTEWQVRACNSGGCGEWSNVCVVRAGQALYTTSRPLAVYHHPEWQRTTFARWRLAPFDTARVGIITQYEAQVLYAQRMMELFGRWWDPRCGCYRTELP